VVLLFGERVVASPTALVVVTALASLSIVPVYRWLKQTVDRRFLRDRASDERITAELRDLLKLAMLGDPSKTMEAAFSALKVLAPERVELWLREENGDEFHPRRVEPRPAAPEDRSPVPTSSALGQAMLAEKTGGVEGLVPTTLSPEAQADLWDRGLAVAAPVSVQSEVRAFVGLGRRSSGSRFAAGELSFLSMVASQIGLALERGQEGTSIGRYRLDRRLGTGGMAEVYLARQIGMAGFERKVAIKRPLPHLIDDAGYVAMLLDEARLAAQLSHPNIVQTYEVDRQGGTYYIAMEYVDGWSLRSLLRAARGAGEGPSVAVTARIASSLLSALAYAHEAVDGRGRKLGIIHRDVDAGQRAHRPRRDHQARRFRRRPQRRTAAGDADRRDQGNPGLHGAGAGERRPCRRALRRVRRGGGDLRVPDGRPALPRRAADVAAAVAAADPLRCSGSRGDGGADGAGVRSRRSLRQRRGHAAGVSHRVPAARGGAAGAGVGVDEGGDGSRAADGQPGVPGGRHGHGAAEGALAAVVTFNPARAASLSTGEALAAEADAELVCGA
jgi:hypothetical protein